MEFPEVSFDLPYWVDGFLTQSSLILPSAEDRMRLAIALAQQNVEQQTGGPFGAVIVEQKSGKLIAPGVNRVVQSNCSVIHAEILAIMLAQKALETFDLGRQGLPDLQLISSVEPCAMCLGAIYWSGVKSLVIGARDEDARKVGFDEGVKPRDWVSAFDKQGFSIVQDVCRSEAAAVLNNYASDGGIIYNPTGSSSD